MCIESSYLEIILPLYSFFFSIYRCDLQRLCILPWCLNGSCNGISLASFLHLRSLRHDSNSTCSCTAYLLRKLDLLQVKSTTDTETYLENPKHCRELIHLPCYFSAGKILFGGLHENSIVS